MSPLTEGRGLKCILRACPSRLRPSPLTEGRGLKCGGRRAHPIACQSPLTEGRGLKYARYWETISRLSRPSRRGVD